MRIYSSNDNIRAELRNITIFFNLLGKKKINK